MNNHKLIMSLFENSVTFHKIMHHPRFEQPLFSADIKTSKHLSTFKFRTQLNALHPCRFLFSRQNFCFPAKKIYSSFIACILSHFHAL